MAFERRDVGALNFDRTVLLTPLFLRRLPRRCSGIAEWAEVPSRLQRSPALPTAGVQLLAAVRTTHEVGRHCGTASAAQRTHLLDLGDDTQQLVGGRDAGFHLRETVLAERDRPCGDRRFPDHVLSGTLRDHPPHLVIHPHDFVDGNPPAIAGVIAVVATYRAIEHELSG